jgi:hypothetical protein
MAFTHKERSDRRKKMAIKVKEGKSPAEVASSFRVSLSTVVSACIENKVNATSLGREKQRALRELAANIIRDGGTIQQACRKSGLGSNSVYNACYEFGITIPGKINSGGQNDRKSNREAAIADLKRGHTVDKVCKDYRLSVPTLKNACVEFGVDFPKKAPPYTQMQKLVVLKHLMETDEPFEKIKTKTQVSVGAVASLYKEARRAGLIVKVRNPGSRKSKK